ncbi:MULTISPECIES: DUF1643 domain-containing protein [Rhizobium]|uniref:DUF1643 domain-containing protein n=1 Tax=Rhizobium TaxID=379 RepID=UPI0007F09F98|nr:MULTISPECIES: DUF1643 domain-containing protein [Rhizobium]ANL41039.1 hypothetical protein AMC88_CH02662 [Rhizobium phaseoli]ANL60027.1 hypothetical protein AMC85_CH02661 [Rhizobium phaseoli]MDE8763193.1 DUF1643 domain-containing protein [Rhizobium sp. CBK13]
MLRDDATVRKWRGFTIRNGGHRFIVGNVFSYRATDVCELGTADVCTGEDHFEHLDQIIAEADVLVPCWGNSGKVPKKLRPVIVTMLHNLRTSGKPVFHFGLTDSGDPKHPLMLGYDTPLAQWC